MTDEIKRPDWNAVYDNPYTTFVEAKSRQELVQVTRHTAHLALSAIRAQNSEDYYHNFGAAEEELAAVLGETRDVHKQARPTTSR